VSGGDWRDVKEDSGAARDRRVVISILVPTVSGARLDSIGHLFFVVDLCGRA
jgi:hypothetical protein